MLFSLSKTLSLHTNAGNPPTSSMLENLYIHPIKMVPWQPLGPLLKVKLLVGYM